MRSTLKKEPEVKNSARATTKRAVKSAPIKDNTAKTRTPKKTAAKEVSKTIASSLPTKSLSPKSTKTSKIAKSPNTKVFKKRELNPPVNQSETVFVPSKASLRLLEKVQIYKLWYQNQLPEQVSRVASVAGYTFALLGTCLAASGFLIMSNFSNTAALVCALPDQCENVADADLPESAPMVSFLNTVPDKLTNDIDVVVRLDRGEKMIVYLEALFSGDRFVLTPIDQLKPNEFKYLLVKQNLKPGTYEVKAESSADGVTYVFAGSKFSVEGQVLAAKVTGAVEEVLPANSVATTTATAGATETVSAVISDEESATPKLQAEPLALSVEELAGATYLRIKTSTYATDSVYVYSKPDLAPVPILLGQATLVQGDWVFSLSALDLPNVKHELFASFVSGGKSYQTAPVSYAPVINPTPIITTDSDLALFQQKINLSLETAEIDLSQRQTYYSSFASTSPNLFLANNETSYAANPEITAADELLVSNKSALDLLLSHYAAAVLGGQQYLINLSQAKEQAWYKSLLIKSGTKSPVLETILAQRLQVLRDKVKDNEERYMSETNDLITRDSDQDGLADFDEIANFKSNSTKTDSDYDGVIDSIEVVAGYDPNVPDIKFWPTPASVPSSLTKTEAVTIKSVTALSDKGGSDSRLLAVINGQATPYTYVWINVPVLEVLGFIRTNADGNFSYTLEVPIPDESISVVAMLTDNTGTIVAASPEFNFVKQNNKLITNSNRVESSSYLAAVNQEYTSMTTIATAIGVVLLGFVLLLLGSSLQKQPRVLTAKVTSS